MNYYTIVSHFTKDEDAAVTVDWVVLTAALVLVAGGVVAVVETALGSSGTAISSGIVSTVASALT
jgi:Na+-driven multidrug efflux pump